ncbi:Protein of unknown function (DUF2905) [Dyadobacter jejuensis]|uniref:DUF2905 family protein n=1 Tax=Dyadobacter jejuensis TaxID=1082580 RepID=A0A316A6Y4_9BACT|nr:DUF2905 domain-containing protein [Dyadobacter jejuensis]PWJ53232.1 Protein of unknown function (DUF2905) [Dyadobacter jejuensis]
MTPTTAKYLILAGLLMVVVGVVFYFFGNSLTWLGRLPGDIRIEKKGFRLYIPLATMLLISALINLILWLIRKLF